MLDDHARKAAQDHLDAAQEVDPTARAVDVAHPDGDALDGSRILPELFAESSPDVARSSTSRVTPSTRIFAGVSGAGARPAVRFTGLGT